ncbi:MAG TPA: nucleoside 2-deoxyribosyltransferase [Verrucomicrobiae bacterium]|nr:nucleoside 2-deoxyribosyltransferase [Verrucomicrobiae bacterium]
MQNVIYWAAPVFTQAERIWNRMCAEELEQYGYQVILPQDEAKQFTTPCGIGIDLDAVAQHCFRQAQETPILVAILDGADSDSGMSVEVGAKLASMKATGEGIAIGVRTDFRGHEHRRTNAMFSLLDSILYRGSFAEDVEGLCREIDETIRHVQVTKRREELNAEVQ